MTDHFEGKIFPEYFFECDVPVKRWKERWTDENLLPDLASLFGHDSFAEVSMAWAPLGLFFHIEVASEEISVVYPEVQKGDSVELFIDTKNLKNAKTTHRFCHHFCFLPERVEGVLAREVTRFRTEDTHPLCHAEDLEVKVVKRKSGYTMECFIPEKCLHGFQGEEGMQLGFCYRINKARSSQTFGAVPDMSKIGFHPYLWPQLHFTA